MSVDITSVTQHQSTPPRHALIEAVQNASHAVLVMAVVVVALIGTDAAVAVSRTAGSSTSSSSPAGGGATSPTQGGTGTQTPAPTSASTSTSPVPTKTPQRTLRALLAQTFAKALAQHTVHSVARNVSAKTGTAVFVDDDAPNGGIQRISIHGGHIEIRVVGSTTYFTGDRLGLTKYFTFSDSEVTALDGRWLALVAGQTGYRAVTAGVTLASTLREDRIISPLSSEPEKVLEGQRVFGISGRATGAGAPHHASATMWISVDTGLPVEFDAANGDQQLTQTFSDWGKPIHLQSPTNVVGQPGLAS